MICRSARKNLPGYLDGTVPLAEHLLLRAHLDECADCLRLLESYRRLSVLLSRAENVAPPPEMVLRIRLEAARLRERPAFFRRVAAKGGLVCRNILQPLAVPATGGLLAAMLTFMVVAQSLAVGSHFGAVTGDLPLHLVQPARLESLAPFPVSDFASQNGSAGPDVIVVEANVGSLGEVVGYEILSGPDTPALRRQLDEVLMFSRFSPQMSFGRPMPGGRVILSFSEVRVRG